MIPALLESSPVLLAYRMVGLSALAATVAGASAFLFRWRTGTQFPEGPALLLGVGAVAVYLNTRLALVQFLGATGDPLSFETVVVNLGIFVFGGLSAAVGWRAGDRLGRHERFTAASFQPSLSPLVRATGRVITVELPDEIGDIDGYDPVAEATKTALSGKTYHFSRGLTVEQLQAALTLRLRTDHDVGHVDVELGEDGAVEYLAVGRRAAGIGPTLSPGSRATAITADPAFAASPGDTIQIWDPATGERVGTGELRGAVGHTATVSAREETVAALDPRSEYRLMTLSANERADRTFAGMLRRADETLSVVEIQPGSALTGRTVGDLGLSVIAVATAAGATETIPNRDRELAAGERVFAIGHPTHLRRLESAAAGDVPYEPPESGAGPKTTRPGLLGRLRGRGGTRGD